MRAGDRFVPGPAHREIVFLTGSGISARTGLGTFRGPDGLWALEPETEAAMQASCLPDSLPQLWQVWGRMARIARDHGPTPGHRAIARLGAPVITQNIDGLHQAAGSAVVSELHGSALRAACLGDDCRWTLAVEPGEGPRAEDHGVPGRCPRCGAPTRPDVVLFDEQLPSADLGLAMELAQRADLFVVVGTSGVVFPAAQLAPMAASHGATTVLIDIAPPVGSRTLFDHVLAVDAHEVLPDWERRIHQVGGTSFLDPFPG
ncbi:NAD-dependent protein deacetylase [Brachybacterium ginsengisoli]|uniref:protein acetyllysine N-acetyltransferase n=1 Tax=Brachybacterium ginsengisoli TaxID=1331682 RepID=A0A291GYK7_9MICO|nr:Sir2 family NAD-dependent protein deacetylase [Brachybacterium ginsengisoli]ATG55186.1 NAD-dependent protein deacetylase [Brachybacterium ginsengisoli]